MTKGSGATDQVQPHQYQGVAEGGMTLFNNHPGRSIVDAALPWQALARLQGGGGHPESRFVNFVPSIGSIARFTKPAADSSLPSMSYPQQNLSRWSR